MLDLYTTKQVPIVQLKEARPLHGRTPARKMKCLTRDQDVGLALIGTARGAALFQPAFMSTVACSECRGEYRSFECKYKPPTQKDTK